MEVDQCHARGGEGDPQGLMRCALAVGKFGSMKILETCAEVLGWARYRKRGS